MRSDSDTADKRIADLERELRGVQEMLAFVLYEVDRPVVITKELLSRGLPNGAEICIDEDIKRNLFVFSLVVPDEQ